MEANEEKKKSGPSGKACEAILYAADGWTYGSIIAVISQRESVKYYAIILHDKDTKDDGTPKEPHFHVYMSFGDTSWHFSDVAKWFNTDVNKIERIKAKGKNARYKYLLYQLHRKDNTKHQYSVSEIRANFDVEQYIHDHDQQARLSEILDRIADGTITRLNYPEYIDIHTYTRHKSMLDRAWEYRKDAQARSSYGERNITVIWISGKSRTGKTTLAKLIARQLQKPLYITAEGKHPFDGYRSQPIVLFDELRPNAQFSFVQLLQIFDNHTARDIDARYFSKSPDFEVALVTSIFSPEEFYRLSNVAGEDVVQFYRRITQYWEVTADRIDVNVYDCGKGMFVPSKTLKNPVPGYLETIEKPSSFDSLEALRSLVDRYTEKQLTLDTLPLFTELDGEGPDNPFIRRI